MSPCEAVEREVGAGESRGRSLAAQEHRSHASKCGLHSSWDSEEDFRKAEDRLV